ncbi:hypothetical protein DPMN_065212 [Dreissena polymorpha]|uniref:Uncharacterized protein n=1 Tax=Dreissena polymorpha TaxID=45954 RepID=A0A9D4HMW9_DREPO|nr:hypothetical protein DPMN_065212 [Dreissena polymorpha]
MFLGIGPSAVAADESGPNVNGLARCGRSEECSILAWYGKNPTSSGGNLTDVFVVAERPRKEP